MGEGSHRFPLFLFLLLLQVILCPGDAQDGSAAIPPRIRVPVGVVLDMSSVVGRTGMTGLQMALEDFYAAHPGYTTRIELLPRNSHSDIVVAASSVISLLKDGAQAIIGPQTSGSAEFIADLANTTHVPVLSFSATSPSLSAKNTRYLLRVAVNDSAQADPIAAIVQNFQWKQAVTIYEDSEFGAGMIPFLVDSLRKVDCHVPYRSVIPTYATDDYITMALYKLKTMQTRVFLVHMSRRLGTRLLSLAHDAGMMENGYVWIVTDEITSILGVTDSRSTLRPLQGVIGVKPHVPPSQNLENFKKKWRIRHLSNTSSDPDDAAPSQFVLWAYDTAFALATAVEHAGIAGTTPPSLPLNGSHDLAALGVSKTGPRLLDAILAVRFDGLSGEFELINGQNRCEAFEIVSVTGETERTIGYWTREKGLTRSLKGGGSDGKREVLAPVIWPGETVAIPKGWEVPVSGRRLRIAVPGPVDPGFQAFLRMDWDPVTNKSNVGGFVIDVFEAAVRQLPYAILWDYVPFQTIDGKSAGNYNDLVRNVSAGVFDGVVGDVTITEKRAAYVDFTMPYTTSGVSMVVPKKDHRCRNEWIFLRPLTKNLWLMSGAAFIFTGIVVWLLEHRINDDFRGELAQQLGTVFHFSFSTLVFAHSEKILSNLSRVVVVVWLFVVLILQSSYTASLTSMLTVQQLRPTVAEITELINSNQPVGYLKDSFMKGKLLDMGFKANNLVPLQSPQQYSEMLTLGSDGGGVAAIIDETPYLKVFLKDYCANFTMTGQQLKTGGFGFAFPRGSPLVPDLSRAILNITEMSEIERKWLGDPTSCLDSNNPISADSLGLTSFGGLFLITGIITLSACVLYIVAFFYEKKNDIMHQNVNDGSMSSRIKTVARMFDEKKSNDQLEGTRNMGMPRMACDNETPFNMPKQTFGDTTTPSSQVDMCETGPSTPNAGSERAFGV